MRHFNKEDEMHRLEEMGMETIHSILNNSLEQDKEEI